MPPGPTDPPATRRGERLGACTDCRSFWARDRAGELSETEIGQLEQALCPTAGTCMVMGTASTMACVTEALGLMLPGGAAPPSGSGDRLGTRSRRAGGPWKSPSSDPSARHPDAGGFEYALTVWPRLAVQTNAIVHLLAIARRAGVALGLEDFHRVSQRVPVLVDCKPAGHGYVEDLHRAGGVPVLLKALEPLLDLSTVGVSGIALREQLAAVAPPAGWQRTIRPLDSPLGPPGALVVLRGSLAPDGAVIECAAASKDFLKHRGPAVVFESAEDAAQRLDDPALGITPRHVLVLRNAGPSAPGCRKPAPCRSHATLPRRGCTTWCEYRTPA